ncbi:MAG: adenosylcobinamide-GDP ribazoletransferase, partial [Myxococcales bacterium]|nr:adenosylcobinamide-GDP ribazoletransferase [Myxococcales bacterium]
DGASKSRLVARARTPQAIVATLWSIALVSVGLHFELVEPSRALALFPVLGVITVVAGWRFHVRAGGITGDFLGATEQLAELAVLVVLAWR